MGWGILGNIGNAIKKGVTDTGHFVGGVLDNPVTKGALAAGLAATGVGAPAAAAIMAGSGLLGGALHEGGNLSDAFRGTYQGALTGGTAGLVGTAGRALLGQTIGGAIKDAAGNIIGDAGSYAKNHLGTIAGLPFAGSVGNAVKGAAGAMGVGGDDGINPVVAGLAAAQTANAASLGKKANDYADMGWNAANNDWQSRAGLRTQGIQQLQQAALPTTQNTSALTAIRNRIAPQATAPTTLSTRRA